MTLMTSVFKGSNKYGVLNVEKASSLLTSETSEVNKGKLARLLTDVKSLTKMVVLILNVLPVFTGFWLATYFTGTSITANADLFLLTIVGSTLVMAGALMFNNWYEVDLDVEMKRTQSRPTVTGNISLPVVLGLSIGTTVIGFIMLLFTSMEATLYAFVGWFTYVVLYTLWTKRRYTLNTIVGSLSGAVTPLIGWSAIDSAIHVVPMIMFLLLFIWQIPHTFAIAMRRYDEYKAAGVPMLPVVQGFKMTKRQTVIYMACLLPLPLYLTSLGLPFVIIISLINLAWLAVGISGFYMNDDLKWANIVFKTSLYYLMAFFMLMIVFTL